MPLHRLFLTLSACSGLPAVAFGAFGAHGLKNRLPTELMDVWHTAVQYQFWHTLILFAVGALLGQGMQSRLLIASGWLFASGILIFSGSLYLLALSGMRWLGAVTPVGGMCWLLAWACLAFASARGA